MGVYGPEFINDPKKLLGINTGGYPQTPSQVRAAPVFPTPASHNQTNNNAKQSSTSNGLTTSSSQSSSSTSSSTLRSTYNNNTQNNSTQQQHNNYHQQSSSQKPINLLPPPASRANTSNGGASTNITPMRPPESIKPLTNGRLTIPQLNKHEVNRTFYTLHLPRFFPSLPHKLHFTLHTLCAFLFTRECITSLLK